MTPPTASLHIMRLYRISFHYLRNALRSNSFARWHASRASTDIRSHGRTRRSGPPMSSSRWDAVNSCPVFPGRCYEKWTFDDPAGKDVEAVRPIRDEIERRVRRLLAELDIPISPS